METIKKLFEHDAWAVRRILESLKANENAAALKTLGHLLVTEKVWLMRLEGLETALVNPSPELTLAECETLANEMREAYAAFLDSRDTARLNEKIRYKNYAGTEFNRSLKV